MRQSLQAALDQARDQAVNLSDQRARHSAIMSTEMLQIALTFMIEKGEKGGTDAFTDAAFDVMAAQASLIASVAMTITQGKREEAEKFIGAWIRTLQAASLKVVNNVGNNAIEVVGEA